jgi:hypothetical protein
LGGEKPRRKAMKRKNPVIVNSEQLSLILNISEFTVKKLAKTGDLPCTYVNRRPHFDMEIILKRFEQLEGGAA